MDGRNTKNYYADGGDTLVIGGKVIILPGAVIEGLEVDPPAFDLAPSEAKTVAELRDDLNKVMVALGLTVAQEAPEDEDK